MSLKDGILAIPGVIDSDNRGNIQVLLLNTSEHPFAVTKGKSICQMITHTIPTSSMKQTSDELTDTDRGTQGFGSTELRNLSQQQTCEIPGPSGTSDHDQIHVIPPDDIATASFNPSVHTAFLGELLYPFSIHLSSDPYDHILTIRLTNSGNHPHRGLLLEICPERGLPKIKECLPCTPAAKYLDGDPRYGDHTS